MDDLQSLAERAVQAACMVTHAVQSKMDLRTVTRTKADQTPVTVADYAAQAVVGFHLGESFVGEEDAALLEKDPPLTQQVLRAAQLAIPELTEESMFKALRNGNGACSSSGFWTLDPVDGTKGFLRNAHYAVCLAYIVEGKCEVGVLGCPRLGFHTGTIDGAGVVLSAARNRGTVAIDLQSPFARKNIQTPEPKEARLVESAESSHTDHSLGPKLLGELGFPETQPIRIDSQAKYAVVARGDAAILLRRPKSSYREKIWDHAGGSLIAEEAGCVVTDFDGKSLSFDDGEHLRPHRGILVCHPSLHEKILGANSL